MFNKHITILIHTLNNISNKKLIQEEPPTAVGLRPTNKEKGQNCSVHSAIFPNHSRRPFCAAFTRNKKVTVIVGTKKSSSAKC
jgi:hypothetical protein